ncbi:hypothetical protein IGA63_14845, partial [Pseudomonas aeruginosa]|nr:hypothetical protein [Pseudomonas aeruginosa]
MQVGRGHAQQGVDQRRAFDQGGLQQLAVGRAVLAAEDVAGEARELVAVVAGAAQRGEHFVEDRLDVGQGGAGVDGQFAAAVTDVGGVAAGAIQPDPGFAGRLAGFPAQAGVGELAVVLLVEGEAARQAQFAALPVAQRKAEAPGVVFGEQALLAVRTFQRLGPGQRQQPRTERGVVPGGALLGVPALLELDFGGDGRVAGGGQCGGQQDPRKGRMHRVPLMADDVCVPTGQ